jgi:hypothetical protein
MLYQTRSPMPNTTKPNAQLPMRAQKLSIHFSLLTGRGWCNTSPASMLRLHPTEHHGPISRLFGDVWLGRCPQMSRETAVRVGDPDNRSLHSRPDRNVMPLARDSEPPGRAPQARPIAPGRFESQRSFRRSVEVSGRHSNPPDTPVGLREPLAWAHPTDCIWGGKTVFAATSTPSQTPRDRGTVD